MTHRLSSILNHLRGSVSSSPGISASPDLFTHSLSPTHFLPRAAVISPHHPAIVHRTRNNQALTRTYSEFADRARGLAYFFLKHGLKRVGVVAPNTPAFLECIFGVPAAGGVLVPVNYRLKGEDVAWILEFADVDCVVVDAEFEDLLGGFRKRNPKVKIVVDEDTGVDPSNPYNVAIITGLAHDMSLGSHGWTRLPIHPENETSPIALPFTSGTTSRPKGVLFTHRGAYLASLANIIENQLNSLPGDRPCRYLWTLPLFHAVGWTFPWSVTAVRGTHYCLRKIDYPVIWELLKQEGITHYCAAPTVNTGVCNAEEATKLEFPVRVVVAGSPPTAKLFEDMTTLNLLPRHVYGMTETYGPVTCSYEDPSWSALPADERFPLMARQGHGFVTSLPIRVVKSDSPKRLVDVAKDGTEIGEIVFSGNILCAGYYKDSDATTSLFSGGALHSGDLAVWHPDGSVQIQDRAKDIIISGGENISSVALENALVKHPDILEVAVVAAKDEKWGERPVAYVTVKNGKLLSGDDVIEWSKGSGGVSGFMVPREIVIVEALPKTSTGKIQKNVLRAWAKEGKRTAT